jgi:enamine deaminase RidA (YjgF/YER057c/UK114 family)
MGRIDDRLDELGLVLPPPLDPPPGVVLPFSMVRIVGDRAIVSGHGPQSPDGSIGAVLGRVPDEVSVEQAYESARLTGLSILADLRRALDDLDRITAWGRVFAMVWSAPDFHHQPAVVNGFSDLVLEVFGPEVGAHARSAVGMASLPFRIPVEIECEVVITS